MAQKWAAFTIASACSLVFTKVPLVLKQGEFCSLFQRWYPGMGTSESSPELPLAAS